MSRFGRCPGIPGIFVLVLFSSLLVWPTRAATQVVAWGAGSSKTKDNNNQEQSIVPKNLTNAVQVAAGWRHSMALLSNPTNTSGWGNGQPGDTNFPPIIELISNPPPVFITNVPAFSAIACGYIHTLGLETNGQVYPIGDDQYGQLELPFLTNAVGVAAGFYHSLVLRADGTVVACGATNSQAILQGMSHGQSIPPGGLSNVVAIAGGYYHSLALKSDGTVAAWGGNTYSQCSVPPDVTNIVAIAAGSVFSAALRANGRVVVWGDNTDGQTNVPAGLSNVVAIACGGWHMLALKSNGTVVAWGAGTSAVPNISYQQNVVPANLTNVIQIAAGTINSLALVGTNPPVAQSRLTMTNAGANGLVITVPSQNGRVYRLEYKNSLNDPVWNGFSLQAGTGRPLQFIDSTPASAQRFYRITRW